MCGAGRSRLTKQLQSSDERWQHGYQHQRACAHHARAARSQGRHRAGAHLAVSISSVTVQAPCYNSCPQNRLQGQPPRQGRGSDLPGKGLRLINHQLPRREGQGVCGRRLPRTAQPHIRAGHSLAQSTGLAHMGFWAGTPAPYSTHIK